MDLLTSVISVGKHVVGPVPGAGERADSGGLAALTAGLEIVPLEDGRIEATDAVTDESINGDVDAERTKDADKHVTEGIIESFGDDVAEVGVDNGKVPRVPPNTPAKKERIWWENERLVIKKSKLGGLGAFAAKDLKYGDKILEEVPILRTNNWGICNEYDALSDEDRELFHSLHKFSSNPNAHEIEKIRRANSWVNPILDVCSHAESI